MGFFDGLRKLTKKEVSHDRMRKIRESGKDGERHFEQDNVFSKIKRVHHGADYVKPVHDSAGRERKVHYEVKQNNSPLSKLQKKTHGLRVVRYVNSPYGKVKKMYNRNNEEIEEDPFTNKVKKVRKRDSSGLGGLLGSGSSSKQKTSSGYDSTFGSELKRSRRNNDYSFGSGLDNMFGAGNSRPSTRRKRSNDYSFGSGLDNMFGTGSSGRRKRNSSDSWGFGF